MLQLPNVTLICLTNRDFEGHKRALEKSCAGINWGGVKMIWDEKCTSIDEWNRKIIFDLPKYIDTSHALLIHADGYVINPHLWRNEWLGLDYIGAPWPLPKDDFSYRDEDGNIVRVGNSVSLRSKKMMDLIATTGEQWAPYFGFTNEDGYISCHNRRWLERQGCKFATLEQAVHFSKEHEFEENKGIDTFAFHSL